MKLNVPLIPASFFALTLGLAETGNAWRFAARLWNIPAAGGEAIEALAVLSFVFFAGAYLHKWLTRRAAALAEVRDPVQSLFMALIPEAVILVALALQPHAETAATVVFWTGSAANALLAAYRLTAAWTQPRQPAQVVPPLYLPYTASVLVNALAAGVFGYTDYGWALFGVGAISWLVLDSSITQQLMNGGLAAKTRNFMGIYAAPPVVALVAYQVLSGADVSNAVSYALAGYAVFIFAGLVFALRWLAEQDFAAGYWAYTFGLATLAQGLMLMAQRGHNPLLETLAAVAFALTLLLVAYVAAGTVRLLVKGSYFPAPVAA